MSCARRWLTDLCHHMLDTRPRYLTGPSWADRLLMLRTGWVVRRTTRASPLRDTYSNRWSSRLRARGPHRRSLTWSIPPVGHRSAMRCTAGSWI
jgi:hypothetical protein